MKTKSFLILTVFLAVISFLIVSCKYAIDAQLTAFEKKIEYLECSYKDLTSSELRKNLNQCEEMLSALKDKYEDFTENQKERLSYLKGRYHRLLLKIELTALKNSILTKDGLVEYLRGLMAAD